MNRRDVDALLKAAKKNPNVLLDLSEEQQAAAAAAIIQVQDELYANDPYMWAVDQVHTIDEASNQILPFPDRAYLHDLFDVLETEKKLAFPKSRRMIVTWAISIFLLHRVRFRRHFAGFVQSEVETKSAYVLDKRMAFVEDHLPPIYRRPYSAIRGVSGLITKMTYQTGSYAWAIAQGSDVFRTYTPTFIFMDEIEFMQQGHQSFVAALPFAEKNCQIVLVSTSNGPHGVLADMAREAGFQRFA